MPDLKSCYAFLVSPFRFFFICRPFLSLIHVTILLTTGKQYKILNSSRTSSFDPNQDSLQPVFMHSIYTNRFRDWIVTCISLQAINGDHKSMSNWKVWGYAVLANTWQNVTLHNRRLMELYKLERNNININSQLDATIIILLIISISSTCFGR